MRPGYPVVALLLAFSIAAGAQVVTDSTGFRASLSGKWRGQAVHTPIGPTPYDIDFQRQDGPCLTGTAYNGFSHHTWTFCGEGDRLALDFLSDFRGNTRPIHFRLVSATETVMTFHADSHDFMDVLLSVREKRGWIKILHHGKLHVEIHLER